MQDFNCSGFCKIEFVFKHICIHKSRELRSGFRQICIQKSSFLLIWGIILEAIWDLEAPLWCHFGATSVPLWGHLGAASVPPCSPSLRTPTTSQNRTIPTYFSPKSHHSIKSRQKILTPRSPNSILILTDSTIFKKNPLISPLSKNSFSPQIRQ